MKVAAQTSECSPSGPPSLSSTLMSSPAVGDAGRVGCEAYQASRMPRNELQSCPAARFWLYPPQPPDGIW